MPKEVRYCARVQDSATSNLTIRVIEVNKLIHKILIPMVENILIK